MKITNKTKNKAITEECQIRDTFFGRFRGLMLSKKKDIVLAAKKESIIDSTIHMMNMLYPIDVIWVNEKMTVVDIKEDVKPFSILRPSTWKTYAPRESAKYTIELGTTKMGDVEVGDEIEFQD